MTDREAMDELTDWFVKEDPKLNDHLPNWVWDLTALIDDLLVETDRIEYDEDDQIKATTNAN